MKNGFNREVEKVFRQYNMINGIGYVSDNNKSLAQYLRRKGYLIETDIGVGGFDFMYLSRRDSSSYSLSIALTKLNFYGIIVVNGEHGLHVWRSK